MQTGFGQACGKIILFGEHAVVYGQPAIAIPVMDISARATTRMAALKTVIRANDLGKDFYLEDENGLSLITRLALEKLGKTKHKLEIALNSSIPIASGLGSGAAISTAIARSISDYYKTPFSVEILNEIVYETEKYYHGTPSGIDNTVICYEKPVLFIKQELPQTFMVKKKVQMLIGDTGIASHTINAVADVRRQRETNPSFINEIISKIGKIARLGEVAISNGNLLEIGALMNENHKCLQNLDVSSPELDILVRAAISAGAFGAKLSGGGRGGNMIAVVDPKNHDNVLKALLSAGAKSVISTTLESIKQQ